jgi:hypothetical protein
MLRMEGRNMTTMLGRISISLGFFKKYSYKFEKILKKLTLDIVHES